MRQQWMFIIALLAHALLACLLEQKGIISKILLRIVYIVFYYIILMRKKMKILAASDLHGDSRVTKKLAERAEKEKDDLVVLCGDLTGFNDGKCLIKPFKDKGKK